MILSAELALSMGAIQKAFFEKTYLDWEISGSRTKIECSITEIEWQKTQQKE